MSGAAEGTLKDLPVGETPSVALYLAGWVVTLCGTLAANEALPQPDSSWTLRTVLLSTLGFVFSYGSRRLGFKAQNLDFGFAAGLALLLGGLLTGQFFLEQLLPLGASDQTLRLLSALVWGGTVWSWALRSDSRVMGTAVPAMAALGLAATQSLNNPVLIIFGVFVLTVIFLLIHQNFLQNQARAGKTVGKAPQRLLLVQLAQSGICGLLVLLAGLVVIVPAQALFARLSVAQAIRQLAAVKPVAPGASAALRFSDSADLPLGTGAAFSASPEVVMRVTPSDGQEHYWRGRTYDRYTGTTWQSTLGEPRDLETGSEDGDTGFQVPSPLTPGDLPALPGTPLTAVFKVLGETDQIYYAGSPRQLLLQDEALRSGLIPRVSLDGRIDFGGGAYAQRPYAVTFYPAPDGMAADAQARLRQAGKDYPDDVRRLYLGLPSSAVTTNTDLEFYRRSVAEALQTLPPSRQTPLDKALALREWVSRRCTYSLAPKPIPVGDDHVRVFLDTARRGYCDMFASSLAILCRTAGIPARLATGFAPGDPDGDSFNLRGEDKHAWTEVYFPGTGWVSFDATAGSQTDGSVPRVQSGNAFWRRLMTRLRFSLGAGAEFVLPLLLVVLGIVGYVIKTEIFDRRRAGRRAKQRGNAGEADFGRSDLGRQYARMSRTLGRLGLPRQAAETPGEYAARAVPFLAETEQALGMPLPSSFVLPLSSAFARACYAPAGVGQENRAGENSRPDDNNWAGPVSRLAAASRRVFWLRLWRRMTARK